MTNTTNVDKLLKNGRAMFLAYDQGFEHGPTDFNEKNVDPKYILDIAQKAQVFTAIIFQKGIAEKYYPIGGLDIQKTPPLLVKLNGKTSFHKGEEPYSPQLCSVDEAIKLGASAVGYTIYVGSEHEAKMMEEFAGIEEEAHAKNLAVTLWAYPRGKHVEGKETERDTVAYGTRLALELGADFVKVPYTGDHESFSWVVKAAGDVKVLVQGGSKKTEEEVFNEVEGFMSAGASGMAIGRNIWQSDDPVEMAKKIADIIWSKNG
jgi:class I fructose-bisphosphate aldolase